MIVLLGLSAPSLIQAGMPAKYIYIYIYIDVHGHVYGCGTTSLCQPNPANEGAMLFGETCLFAAVGFMVL